jgi:hypothetical protein
MNKLICLLTVDNWMVSKLLYMYYLSTAYLNKPNVSCHYLISFVLVKQNEQTSDTQDQRNYYLVQQKNVF